MMLQVESAFEKYSQSKHIFIIVYTVNMPISGIILNTA